MPAVTATGPTTAQLFCSEPGSTDEFGGVSVP
jgi:hypothetical protein